MRLSRYVLIEYYRCLIETTIRKRLAWKWKNAFLNPEDSTLEPIMRQVAKNVFDLK